MKIGLEVHVGLPTKTKLFCRCKAYATEVNTAICPICTGLPGAKPMLNKKALEISVDISNALNCIIEKETSFVRKVYFYPDLPKSFQITQKDMSVGHSGNLKINNKTVRIRRIQLEEDPAKILREDNYTLIDYNRSGQPLVEIVTEPDINSEEELKIFMNELKSILYYLGVDIDQDIKVDLNISLSDSRVEIKNVTGLKNLIDAAKYEVQRQEKLIQTKQQILQETRSYSEAKLSTISSREKESDEEYGFIFEPDLTVYNLENIKPKEPIYTSIIAKDYSKKYGVSELQLLEIILFDKNSLKIIQTFAGKYEMKAILNALLSFKRYSKSEIKEKIIEKAIQLVQKGSYLDAEVVSALEKGEEININSNIVNTDEIDSEIRSIINKNKQLLEDYKTNKKAMNSVIGMVLKKFKANPRVISERLEYILSNEFKV